jgi:putative aminopeptidase FrvX
MMKLDNLLIEKLFNEDGIAGHEKAVRNIM